LGQPEGQRAARRAARVQLPKTKALSEVPVNMKDLPFDPMEYIEHDPPFDRNGDPDWGQ
jgi:hypothetical protein